MKSLLVLGRQPALGLAELESLYGPDLLQPAGNLAVIVDVDPCELAFDRLGGSTKFCKLLTELDTTSWQKIEKYLLEVSPGHSERMTKGKMLLGLSAVGFNISINQLEATGLSLKKAIRRTGRPVRLVPNKAPELNAAQVIHNKLTGPTGWELVFVRDGHKTIVAQTVKVQDIEAYTKRDRRRPARDAKVGMLPPKLAQIIINLGAGRLPADQLQNICNIPAGQPIPKPLLNKTVLDPFCGTGVILQEALLMGYSAIATDLEPRMVEYTDNNIAWLKNWYDFQTQYEAEVGDATTHQWAQTFDFVATETYLGRPFTAKPSHEILQQTISETNLIIKRFLQNIHGQLNADVRLALAVPAWQTKSGQFKHLPLIDSLSDLGYNLVKFEHVQADLIYHRSDQTVARQLLVITRK